jgi:hypothetical protein
VAAMHDELEWPVYMHTRRFITFLLGAWFTLILTVAGETAMGFQVANKVAKAQPGEAVPALSLVGESMTNQLFQYVAAEINRRLLEVSGVAELGILLALTSILLLQDYSRVASILAGMLLLAAIASHFLLTPHIVAQGRILDFRGAEAMITERTRFTNIHRLYWVVMVFRLLCGIGITALMMYRGSNSHLRRRRGDGDTVDNTEDGHVNG